MLDFINVLDGTRQTESSCDTPEEIGFARVYFAYYPYLGGNA